MALTNYGILTCKGTAEVVADVGTVVTFDVTQGAVLDALKAGIAVLLIIESEDSGVTMYSYGFVMELFISAESVYCELSSTEIGLDDPDALLTFTIDS